MQVVYLQCMSIKVHTICNRVLIVGIPPQIGDPDVINKWYWHDLHEASEQQRDSRTMVTPPTRNGKYQQYITPVHTTFVHKTSSAHLQTCSYHNSSHSIFRYISDQDYTLWAPCPFTYMLHLSISLHGGIMWEPSMGSSHRLPNHYRGNAYVNLCPSNSLINRISMATNNRNNSCIVMSGVYTWVHHKTWTEIYGKTLQAVNETQCPRV
jgi:hypothetical protein